MHLPNSSTSNSEPSGGKVRHKTWRTLVWAMIWILILDVAVNIAFAFPSDVRNTNPDRLQLFFDYGRSMEGRLRRMTRTDPEKTAPITLAGWYDPLKVLDRPAKPGGQTVSIYGMSHAVRLADALQKKSALFSVRSIGAPGAPTNWAYGAFRRDRSGKKSQVAVLAIMSSTLPMITSVAPMTWNESFPLAYTSDRYKLQDGRLKTINPPYESFANYTTALQDPVKWQASLQHMARNDPFYDPLLFNATALDNSSLIRMIRRAWGTARDREIEGKVITARGFDKDSEAVLLANAIIAQFAKDARKDGIIPVIYIVNNYGFSNQLYLALKDGLQKNSIPFLSSDQFIDSSDPSNYLPDTHFTDKNDERLAVALDSLIRKELKHTASSQHISAN
jgi:hypothetical protein